LASIENGWYAPSETAVVYFVGLSQYTDPYRSSHYDGIEFTKPQDLEFTLWLFNIAIEHGPVEIVDFPIEHGDFP
jgi:hypothetical protein